MRSLDDEEEEVTVGRLDASLTERKASRHPRAVEASSAVSGWIARSVDTDLAVASGGQNAAKFSSSSMPMQLKFAP